MAYGAPFSSGTRLEITVNGNPHQVPEGTTVVALLEQLQVRAQHVAVEQNREIVPRSAYARQMLQPGDEIEVVTLVGGG